MGKEVARQAEIPVIYRFNPHASPGLLEDLQASLAAPRPPQIGTRLRRIDGQLREVRVFAGNYQPPSEEFNRHWHARSGVRRKAMS